MAVRRTHIRLRPKINKAISSKLIRMNKAWAPMDRINYEAIKCAALKPILFPCTGLITRKDASDKAVKKIWRRLGERAVLQERSAIRAR